MLERDNSKAFEPESERQREESVEASDRGRGSRVPKTESTLNPAVTKGQLTITLLSMVAESASLTSPVPPGQEGGRREAQDSQGKSKWNSPSLACFPTVSCEARLRSIQKESGGERVAEWGGVSES